MACLFVRSKVHMICIWSNNATATPLSFSSLKFRMVDLSGASLPRIFRERPLSGEVVVVVFVVYLTFQ